MTEKEYDQRTGQQNKAIRLFWRIVADQLNFHGFYMNRVLGGTNSDEMSMLSYDLHGALLDMQREGGDQVVMDTIERVSIRLAQISRKLEIEIQWTPENVGDIIWRPIQKALTNTTSTTELTTKQVDEVYEHIAKFLAEKFSLNIPFPSEESLSEEQRV